MGNPGAKAETPMSATGTSPRRDAGFTLVEAMTALMIVGLMAGAVVLMAPGRDDVAREAADQLAARLMQASDESVLADKPIALVISNEGYGFMRLEENGWLRLQETGALSYRAWPRDAEGRVESSAFAQDEEDGRVAVFDPLGGATPARIVVTANGAAWRVAVDGVGDVDVARVE